MISVIISFLIYLIYNIVAIKLFGIPNSLSNTFYLYKDKKPTLRLLFPAMMFIIVAFLMPAWLDISAGNNLQFMAFLAAGSIMFVGAAPAFKENSLENRVHSVSAICAALFALLWAALVAKMWYIIILWTIVVIHCAVFTNTYKTAYIYWLETIAFLSTFTSIILYFIG